MKGRLNLPMLLFKVRLSTLIKMNSFIFLAKVSTTNFRKCQVFVERVGECRFNKVKNRQVNKFNKFVCEKQGNITWETLQSTRVIASFLQAGRHQPSLGQCSFPGSQHNPP